MIKFLIGLVIVAGVAIGANQLYHFWGASQPPEAPAAAPAPVPEAAPGDSLAGMPANLNDTYLTARQRGAPGLRDFLSTCGGRVSDPRLASIELDYVVLVAPNNPAEAKRVFDIVKARVGADSPVYSRLQQLEKTYQ